MPMAKNRGAAWGAMSRTSPMMVVFSILTAMIIASCFFRYSKHYKPGFGKIQEGNIIFPVISDTIPGYPGETEANCPPGRRKEAVFRERALTGIDISPPIRYNEPVRTPLGKKMDTLKEDLLWHNPLCFWPARPYPLDAHFPRICL
jgi:hypothetical protein